MAMIVFFLTVFATVVLLVHCHLGDTLHANQTIQDGQSLVSAKGIYQLSFFSPQGSSSRYLGISYYNMSNLTVVWVANRDAPIQGSNGILNLTTDGALYLEAGARNIIWVAGSTDTGNSQVRLLDTGNLVLNDTSTGNYAWQSFDQPCDTLLPEMRIGYESYDMNTMIRQLTSWKNVSDPSPGDYVVKMSHYPLPELMIFNGFKLTYRSGPWVGNNFNGNGNIQTYHPWLALHMNSSEAAVYGWYESLDTSILWRFVIDEDGHARRYYSSSGEWHEYWCYPENNCDCYGYCGPYSICKDTICTCLMGFSPKSPSHWNIRNFSDGCVRKDPLSCTSTNEFIKLSNVELPDTSNATVTSSTSLDDCKTACRNNCNCTAYTLIDEQCVNWKGDLVDMIQFTENGADLYVQVASSDNNTQGSKSCKLCDLKIFIPSVVVPVVLLLTVSFVLWKYYRQSWQERNQRISFEMIRFATNNFSDNNKIGQRVYRGILQGGQLDGFEIAVKLGDKQLIRENNLLAGLRHRNIIQLLGFCRHAKELLLCYQYMPNGSLDNHLFVEDPNRRAMLDWPIRSSIIEGISRGLLYLHEESRRGIVHRNVNPTNILLDMDWTPKISGFGFAKPLGEEQSDAPNVGVPATGGYMAPESLQGQFSAKSDVYSFGVLVLEMVTDRPHDALNLVSYQQWDEANVQQLMMDRRLGGAPPEQVERYIRIGLLCVLEDPRSRPDMQTINLHLVSESTTLPTQTSHKKLRDV